MLGITPEAFDPINMILGSSGSLVDAGDHFTIHSQVLTEPISGLQLLESLKNGNLPTQPPQTFALTTELVFHIAPTRVQDLKRPTENTLAATQNGGRTTKNGVSSSNHAPLLAHIGCETP